MKILSFEENVKEGCIETKPRKNMFLVTFENFTFLV